MKRTILGAWLAFTMSLCIAQPVGTAITLQGSLDDDGTPASGTYDFELTLLDGGGAPVGAAIARNDVVVDRGVFSIPIDFGPSAFTGDARRVRIAVRDGTSTGAYTPLSPDTPITAVPYAQLAETASFAASVADASVGSATIAAGSVNATHLASGQVAAAQVNASQVQLRVSGTCAVGSSIRAIAQDGTVSCEADDAAAAGWGLGGNAGTNPATQFVGTIDAQPLVLRAANVPAWRADPGAESISLTAYPHVNSILPGIVGSVIAGGGRAGEPNRVTENYATIGGGLDNVVGDDDGQLEYFWSTIGGGASNTVSAGFSVVGGGNNNSVTAPDGTIGGGGHNTVSAYRGTVGGGGTNTASGRQATVPGGYSNAAGGDSSFAAGTRAKVRSKAEVPGEAGCVIADTCGDEGSFVWADASSTSEFTTTGPNQFLVRAAGGMGLNVVPPGSTIDLAVGARAGGDADADLGLYTRNGQSAQIFLTDASDHLMFAGGTSYGFAAPPTAGRFINTSTGAFLTTGGTWTNNSSRTLKQGFAAVDSVAVLEAVLALPISTWEYRASGEEGRHLGPMAEDFHAAFGLGRDASHIGTVDADGVSLAAIQGLAAKLERQLADVQARLAELEAAAAR